MVATLERVEIASIVPEVFSVDAEIPYDPSKDLSPSRLRPLGTVSLDYYVLRLLRSPLRFYHEVQRYKFFSGMDNYQLMREVRAMRAVEGSLR